MLVWPRSGWVPFFGSDPGRAAPDANGRRWRSLLPCLLPQRTVTNSFDVDLNAILQTTVEGTREKKLNPLMSHVHAATTSPISKANATLSTNVANLDFILDTLSCRLESLEDVVEELQLELKSTITCRVCYRNAPVDGYSHVNVLGCGHAFCSVCAMSMKHCAICKALVVGKFKLFI